MREGSLLFARYAFMPNHLGYCGGPESQDLLEYAREDVADEGLNQIIRQFQAAYPYLQFIASSTGIGDPMDPRVVQAYWLGGDLLHSVEAREFYSFVGDQFAPRIPKRLQKYVLGKVPQGARPHHSFHVLDVSMRTGALKEDVESLDRCRISWGTVTSIHGDAVSVSYSPLVIGEGKLSLAEPVERTVHRSIEGKGYLDDLGLGDTITMHWDWVCDKVSVQAASALKIETQRHLDLANKTL
jgi:hypothetical protein